MIKKVSVIGAGTMGNGIAHVFAQNNFEVNLIDVNAPQLEKAIQTISKNLDRQIAKGTISENVKKQSLANISTFTSIKEGAQDADIVVEAASENIDLKLKIFKEIDEAAPVSTILASNTSSISITKIAAVTKRAEKVIGMHFMNPVPVMKLVEVVKTIATDPAVYEEMVAFGAKLGKTPVRAQDSTGFIVNRLLVPYLLDAIRALEEGVGSIEDIDNSMKLGCGHPMGPLTLLDFVGLDTTYYISQIMFDEFKERRFAAPPLLKRMVLAGWNGRKSGRGFYDYADPQNPKAMKF